jgi:hypothetical protein
MAGGYEYGTDNGAEAVARAGASTANPGLSAIYTNVAGIADTDYVDLYLTNNFVWRQLMFQRAASANHSDLGSAYESQVREWEPTEDEAGLNFGPMLALHVRVADWLVLAIGANGPAAVSTGIFDIGTREHDLEGCETGTCANELSGAARFDTAAQQVIFVWPSIAAGFSFPSFPNLRIGVSFQPSFIYMAFTAYAEAATSLVNDVEATLHVWDRFVPGGQIGVLYRVNGFERLELGLQVRLSDSIDAEGEAYPTINARHDADEPDPPWEHPNERPTTTARFVAPWPLAVVRFGVRYAHPRADVPADAVANYERELFDIELDFIYENTSQMDGYDATISNIDLDPQGLIPAISEVNLHITHDWRDTFGLRLGGSVNLLGGHLTIAAGVSWDSQTEPVEQTRIDYAPWGHYGVSIGVIGRFSILEIALSYEHLFMPDRTVEVGEGEAYRLMAQAGSYPDTVNQDVPINEGHFEGGYDIVGFSLGFRFDRPSRSDEDDEAGDEVEAAAPAGDTTGGEPAVDEAAPADDAPGDESSGETPASDSDGEEMPLEAI